jgi:parvulin-like peptidyl-prolyl isomerase
MRLAALPVVLFLSVRAQSDGEDVQPAEIPAPAVDGIAYSKLVEPLWLDEEPPEVRSLRHIQLVHDGVENGVARAHRTREEALALAAVICERLAQGADFAELAREHSDSPSAVRGAVLGSYSPGMLEKRLNDFLFGAAIGELSPPIENGLGVHVLQRVETHAGLLQILIKDKGTAGRQKAQEVLARLKKGESFADLASEVSEDRFSVGRGGQYAVFERGSNDSFLRAAAFEAEIGEVFGPMDSPLGVHVLKRVAPEEIERDLWENNWVRARVILITFEGAPGAPPNVTRDALEAQELATAVYRRILEGEDMAALARELDEDFRGPERAGDLGWLHRETPRMARFLEHLWLQKPGHLFEPIMTTAGWVVMRRER